MLVFAATLAVAAAVGCPQLPASASGVVPPGRTPQPILDSVYSSGNILDSPPGIQGKVTRNTLYVKFETSATVAQKDAALAAANAEVIGGLYLGDPRGIFHIRLRRAVAAPPDSSSGPLLRARAILSRSPGVRAVMFDRVDSPIEVMSSRPAASRSSRDTVPLVPPDTVPSNFPDYASAISAGNHFAEKVLPDIVVVLFKRGATQQERQSAIERVNGVVIGGRRHSNDDGQYIVRVPSDGTPEPLFKAIGLLERLPQVAVAIPEWFLENVTEGNSSPRRDTVRVLARPPRGTPQAILDSLRRPDNTLDNPPSVRGIVARNALFVQFDSSATVAQKSAALALVDAEVIGGMYFTNPSGYYHIRLRNAIAVPPDSSSGPLLRAERTLRQLPYVRSVIFDRFDSQVEIMARQRAVVMRAVVIPRLLEDDADWDLVSALNRELAKYPLSTSAVSRRDLSASLPMWVPPAPPLAVMDSRALGKMVRADLHITVHRDSIAPRTVEAWIGETGPNRAVDTLRVSETTWIRDVTAAVVRRSRQRTSTP